MGAALEVLTGFVTAPGAVLTALTMAAGNTLTVRNCPFEKRVYLLQAWVDAQVAGVLRIRSPKLHDNVQGIRATTTASDVVPLLPGGFKQLLIPQDTLIAELSGSGVAGQIETAAMLIYYDDLPGTNARLATPDEIRKRMVQIFNVTQNLALGIAGGYSGEAAINATFDLFKANTDYALLGYVCDVEGAVVRWRGADTGNLGIGGPGNETLRHVTSSWFVRLSDWYGLPLIPVFNSANKAGILVDGAQDQAGADVLLTSIFAELAPGAIAPSAR